MAAACTGRWVMRMAACTGRWVCMAAACAGHGARIVGASGCAVVHCTSHASVCAWLWEQSSGTVPSPCSPYSPQVGGLAVHFPLGGGSHKRDYSLQERVRRSGCCFQVWLGWLVRDRSQLKSGAACAALFVCAGLAAWLSAGLAACCGPASWASDAAPPAGGALWAAPAMAATGFATGCACRPAPLPVSIKPSSSLLGHPPRHPSFRACSGGAGRQPAAGGARPETRVPKN